MGKVHTRIYRKDQSADDDHYHVLPDGTKTGGSLYKPNKDRTFPHTHLYEHLGKTKESTLASVGGDHTHVTEAGITSGPKKLSKNDMDRMDSVQQEGPYWVRRSCTGQVLKRGVTRNDVMDEAV